MNDQRQSPDEARIDELAAQELDEWDAMLLTELAAAYDAVDPVPAGLTERLEFALALDEVFAEVAQLSRLSVDRASVRGQGLQTRTQTLTFSADSLTAMITVAAAADGHVRIDGWLTPAAALEVRLRTTEGTLRVGSAQTGRFAFERVPGGMAQLSFHPHGDDGPSVVTPVFEL